MAGSSLSGDFRKLQQWARRIEKAGGSDAMRALADNLAEEALDLVAEGFRNEVDPYGKPWAPKAFSDGRQVLVGRTARLRRGWHRKESGPQGFRIASSVSYSSYHQQGTGIYGPSGRRIKPTKGKVLAFKGGTGKMVFRRAVAGAPARKMVPDKGALPPLWRRHMLTTAREFFAAQFRG